MGLNSTRLTKLGLRSKITTFTESPSILSLNDPLQQLPHMVFAVSKKKLSLSLRGLATLMVLTASAKSLSQLQSHRMVLDLHEPVIVSAMCLTGLRVRQFQQSKNWRSLKNSYRKSETCEFRWKKEWLRCQIAADES